ncbi:MAG: hypothetical protein A2660_00895 [Candidatus Doudnabacteria bacterium RIFCSPHIGHO2_01_FULL_45_18]|uniref:Uncharacterized protein n=1 Tax=Candidatus Doudnabacteria bacterium RIFCSPHIGHO2_01_FULL_45_18 TaxID=1817823 RepID=A0A1F5NRB7_9BACT|nr:MAG: hypothetical protein A2660_00895 [Candidatus Doudnabacteria bacterium RIFCSPHIGHO2_01_FULL_45_18]
MRFISGTIGVIIGFLLIRYTFQLTQWFGKVDWAEKYLGSGLAGTYSMYRLLGMLFIVLSLLYMFGLFGFILGPLAPLFGGAR